MTQQRFLYPYRVFTVSLASLSALLILSGCTTGNPNTANGTGANVGLILPPLSPIAPAIKFLDNGEAICALTAIEPADSPAMVTLSDVAVN